MGRPAAAGATVYEPKGCEHCNERGYRGRIGLFELLPVDAELARQIVEGCHEADIDRYAKSQKYTCLRDDAAQKLLDGHVSYADLVAVSAW